MYAKTKELGPVGGACAGHAPLDPPIKALHKPLWNPPQNRKKVSPAPTAPPLQQISDRWINYNSEQICSGILNLSNTSKVNWLSEKLLKINFVEIAFRSPMPCSSIIWISFFETLCSFMSINSRIQEQNRNVCFLIRSAMENVPSNFSSLSSEFNNAIPLNNMLMWNAIV